ncbi:MAG TPA: hypothetical protein VLX92_34355 [Kofleriaceae bacterium]|nr:hypothetical protein [Kofleriaceae bacterium]
MKKAAAIAGGVVALWLVALVVLDATMADREARRVEQRLGETLDARATVGATDLALVRGRLAFDQLAVRRDDAVGRLALDVTSVRCELPPLGWALVDGDCGELAVRGTRLEASSGALFHLPRPHRHPIRAERVVIDDAELAFAPSALVPSLGRLAIAIDHAESGATVFRTPLSWIFALDQLRARIELPAGGPVELDYRGGTLRVTGSLLGAQPVELPVELPDADRAQDARDELDLLVDTALQIAERLVAQRAEDWLRTL